MNDKGEVCCHHFRTQDLKGYWPEHLPHDEFYILMRETIERGRSTPGPARSYEKAGWPQTAWMAQFPP